MNVITSVANLLFPPMCFSCNERLENSTILCNNCIDQLIDLEGIRCTFCHKEISHGFICDECKTIYPFDEVVCAYMYNSPIQSMIHHFKYNEFKKIGTYLGKRLADKLSHYDFTRNTDYIIPVPLHRTKERFRGFNQAEIIAKAISKSIKIPILSDVIRRKKFTQTQTKLDHTEREKNVADAFILKDSEILKKKSILLVDDVLTTGSTMKSIALLLKENLAAHVYVCTLARA
ncbi:MAG: ComF family protein [Candidatus Cloacimonetes bacterium]|nr:ComF family protein [Candidatus Cloacimonadota bacterium]